MKARGSLAPLFVGTGGCALLGGAVDCLTNKPYWANHEVTDDESRLFFIRLRTETVP